MRFSNAYVRGTAADTAPEAAVQSLAALLVEQPVEVLFSARGARRGPGGTDQGREAAAALARRNIRSLLAINTTRPAVVEGLRTALAAPPRDAEDALEDAGLELNLRHSLFVTPDATLRIENRELIIADDLAPSVRIARIELREAGAGLFGPEAVARLVSLDITHVRLSKTAVLPLALQREPGALMEPDTARDRLRKGDWRANRVPHFQKEFCITCARCFVHCPDNAIMHAMFDKAARDSTGILGIDYDRCTACGICASVCPTDRTGHKAIVMIAAGAEADPEVHHVV